MPSPKQKNLFECNNPAPVAPELGLRIQESTRKPLSKSQKRFNTLLKELESLRKRLLERRELDQRVRLKVQELMVPAMQREQQAQHSLILGLHQLLMRKGAKKVPRSKAKRALIEEDLVMRCAIYLDQDESDSEVRAIHDAHSSASYAELLAATAQDAQLDFSDMFGEELPEDLNLEDIQEAIARAFADSDESAGAAAAPPPRKHSEKARKRAEERAAAEQQARLQVTQSVREVYRKLVSALHPDRASDDADRQRRHDLMQRANGCYENFDLLGLLSLQLEIEQIDAEHLTSVSEQRLQHYNKVLREQSSELKHEIAEIEQRLSAAMSHPVRTLTAQAIMVDLEVCVAGVKRHTHGLVQLAANLDQPATLAGWLRQLEQDKRERDLAEEESEIELVTLLDALFAGADFDDLDGGFNADDDVGPSPGRARKPASKPAAGKAKRGSSSRRKTP